MKFILWRARPIEMAEEGYPAVDANNYPAVEAVVSWRGLDSHDRFHEIKPGYTAGISTIPPNQLCEEDKEWWTVVVRQVKSIEQDRQAFRVIFQIASPRGPHERLRVGMTIGFKSFPKACVGWGDHQP